MSVHARTLLTMIRERLKAYLNPTDVFFGLLPTITGYAAFESWASLIVRAIRGEEAKKDWRVLLSTGAFMASRSLVSGSYARETATLRAAAVEMRALLHEASEDARRRDERAAEQQDRMTSLTKWLVLLAAFTLAAAVVTLVVSIIGA